MNEYFDNTCTYIINYINDNIVKIENDNDIKFDDFEYRIIYTDALHINNLYRILLVNCGDSCTILYQYYDNNIDTIIDCMSYSIKYDYNYHGFELFVNTVLTNIISFIEYTKTNDYMHIDFCNIHIFDTLNELTNFIHNKIDNTLSYDDITDMYNVSFFNDIKPIKWFLSNNTNCGIFGCKYTNNKYAVFGCNTDYEVNFDKLVKMLNDKQYINN